MYNYYIVEEEIYSIAANGKTPGPSSMHSGQSLKDFNIWKRKLDFWNFN